MLLHSPRAVRQRCGQNMPEKMLLPLPGLLWTEGVCVPALWCKFHGVRVGSPGNNQAMGLGLLGSTRPPSGGLLTKQMGPLMFPPGTSTLSGHLHSVD